MNATDLGYTPATELARLIRTKAVSPVEVTRAVLDRIERVNPVVNAFCTLTADAALAAARDAERAVTSGARLGPLHGIPFSVKDLNLTKGVRTMSGSFIFEHRVPDADAAFIPRLRQAGGIFLGKTTSPEFGWKALGDSPLTGITRNPWNLAHTPGGSSAGAAAALAAGIGPLALGTDGGGSIRIPCGFTGLAGLKPSFGRVPAYPPSVFGLVAHNGPMARSVADLALLLNVIAGADDRDVYGLPPDGRDYTQGLDDGVKRLRIAFSPALGYSRVDAEVAAAVERAARRFAELGAAVETVDPGFDDPAQSWLTLWWAGAAKAMSVFSTAERRRLDPGLEESAQKGARLSAMDWLAADQARAALSLHMAKFHRRFDLLVTPSVAVPALKVGELVADPTTQQEWIDWSPFSYPFNLTRQPAASVPCGLTEAGLPIGLHIVGRMHEDALVLRAARAYERSAPPPLCPLD